MVTNTPCIIWICVCLLQPYHNSALFALAYSTRGRPQHKITILVFPLFCQSTNSITPAVKVWAALVYLIWFNTFSCVLHAVMKVVCPSIASVSQLLTMLTLHICYVEEQKYKCLKKKPFLFLWFYQDSITKFQTFHTKIWLNVKKYLCTEHKTFTSISQISKTVWFHNS